jgi:antitoxin PrlF
MQLHYHEDRVPPKSLGIPMAEKLASFSESTLTLLEKFLDFLAQDMENNPQHLKEINSDLVSRVQSLISEVDLDLDAPLLHEDE